MWNTCAPTGFYRRSVRRLIADRLMQESTSFLCDYAYFVVSYRDAFDRAFVFLSSNASGRGYWRKESAVYTFSSDMRRRL